MIDTGLFFFLKHTVLPDKVLTAKIISIMVAMIVNYVLNREWSFRDRGGRERHHEAALFFALNGVGIVVNLAPLWISHYLLGFNAANHSRFFETMADFVSGSVIGTIVAMAFRYWAYQKWVFPELVEEAEDPEDLAREEDQFTFNIPPARHPHHDQHIAPRIDRQGAGQPPAGSTIRPEPPA